MKPEIMLRLGRGLSFPCIKSLRVHLIDFMTPFVSTVPGNPQFSTRLLRLWRMLLGSFHILVENCCIKTDRDDHGLRY